MVARQIDDGIHGRRQHLAELSVEEFPGVFAPVVVSPQKTPAQQIGAELRRLFNSEVGATRLGHHHERTMGERLRITEVDEQ
jgi:hypothetical protein